MTTARRVARADEELAPAAGGPAPEPAPAPAELDGKEVEDGKAEEGKMGCMSSVVPVRRREAYVECSACGAVGSGVYAERGGSGVEPDGAACGWAGWAWAGAGAVVLGW